MPLTVLHRFRKWQASTHNEKTAAHDHFRDLCEVLDVAPPLQDDSIGAAYTYEKRITKAGTGETGYADVWRAAGSSGKTNPRATTSNKPYKQLNEHHESLENPPLQSPLPVTWPALFPQ